MGYAHTFIWTHRHIHLLMALLLLIWSYTQVRFTAEGRAVSKLLETGRVGEEDEKLLMRARIGSRPPSCERRCSSCGPCEAVQVPVAPQDKGSKKHSSLVYTIFSRSKDTSNYKPMNWKCKCGGMIFNP